MTDQIYCEKNQWWQQNLQNADTRLARPV